jgi:hypothetical protein
MLITSLLCMLVLGLPAAPAACSRKRIAKLLE